MQGWAFDPTEEADGASDAGSRYDPSVARAVSNGSVESGEGSDGEDAEFEPSEFSRELVRASLRVNGCGCTAVPRASGRSGRVGDAGGAGVPRCWGRGVDEWECRAGRAGAEERGGVLRWVVLRIKTAAVTASGQKRLVNLGWRSIFLAALVTSLLDASPLPLDSELWGVVSVHWIPYILAPGLCS